MYRINSKKLFMTIAIIAAVLMLSTVNVCAKDINELDSDVDTLINNLPEQAKNDMNSIGADSADISKLKDISFSSILDLIAEHFGLSSKGAVSSGAVVVAVLMLNALADSYKDTLRHSSMKEVMSVVSTLCITATLVMPVIKLISFAVATVSDASDFMLLYIPIMISILAFSGHAVSSAGYYSMMLMVCQAVSQVSSKFITPMLSAYLGISVSANITDRVNLSGLCSMMSKIIKWLIAFVMTVFSALLTIRGMITTAYDSVTTRAVRFTMSSFIPIVGTALSESYKTIQGSINLLRTGAGVFVILAILVVFLPVVTKCVVWLLSVNMCKTVAELLCVDSPVGLLSSVSSVISTVLAIVICIMAIFIISTALLITLGGSS